MNTYISPNTIHILGDGSRKETEYQPDYQTGCQEQPGPKQSRWTKFKAKVKRAWTTILGVAKDFRENILPIITGIGSFLVSWAAFTNRNHQRSQQGACYRCAS